MNEPTNEQLAEWIEKGLATEGVKESHGDYFTEREKGVCKVCALSLAAIGRHGIDPVRDALEANWELEDTAISSHRVLAGLLDITAARAALIERQHFNHVGKSAAEIAQMLRRGEI